MGELLNATAQPRVRILVVEDHADSREALVDTLERKGYEVIAVGDGRAALDALERRVPDLLILDLMLPILSGWELLRILRSRPASSMPPVVVVSAYYTPHRELGAVRFVPKPADVDAILRAIRDSIPPAATQGDGALPTIPPPPRCPDVD